MGAQAAFITAGITTVLALLSVFNVAHLVPPSAFIDAALAAFLGLMTLPWGAFALGSRGQ